MNIIEIIDSKQINKPDIIIYKASKRKWDAIAKPLDSLGKFEEVVSRIAAISGSDDVNIDSAILYVFASDNGVVDEGISQSGQEVTKICAEGIASGRHSVAVMAKKAGVDVQVVDVGINDKLHNDSKIEAFDAACGKILDKKVCMGTRNFAIKPAMTREEAISAMKVGFELVKNARDKGYKLICVGEMGIGNTTTSTAVACSILGISPEDITGRGAGLDDVRLDRKKKVIREAITKYDLYNADALTVLESVGGFDIAAMAGVYIGGAKYGVPVVMDGVISAVAALVSECLVPGTKEYIIPSHMSGEPVMRKILEELSLSPVIDANMSLGEGTGAILMVELLQNVLEVYNHAARFDERDIIPYEHLK